MTEHTFRLPDIGEGIAEAELSTWRVKVGDVVREDDVICEVTTDKASVEIPAAVGGTVTWLGGQAGEVMAIGSDLIRIDSDEAAASSAPESRAEPGAPASPAPAPTRPAPTRPATPAAPRRTAQSAAVAQARNAAGRPLAAPSVRGRARDLGIDLRQLRGTGPAGRILAEDLDDFLLHGPDLRSSVGRTRRTGTEEARVTGVRRTIAERMARAKQRIPHFSIIEEVEVEALEELRAKLNQRFGTERGKLTLLPFLLRALGEAVVDHPEVNAHYDDEAGVITRHEALHCGIATQTDAGLMVPVLTHAEARSLWDTAREIKRLSDSARERRIGSDDLSGSTLTVTSLGPLGALATTPIINHPEVAILGVHQMQKRAVVRDDQIVARTMMNLSLSFDHRVIDGHEGAAFCGEIKRYLEDPGLMMLEMV